MRLLAREDRSLLLRVARAAIGRALGDRCDLDELLERAREHPALAERGDAFVTLRESYPREDALRGCIGTTSARDPLWATVAHIAPRSALNDPRFEPVAASELAGLRIEISVLTPRLPVEDVETVEVGLDGVELVLGERRALLLPQVARGRGWDRTTLLGELSRKAGLEADGWLEADLYRFRADVFGERGEGRGEGR